MSYPSTAKQRLWLTCLGYDVPHTATGPDAQAMFDSKRHYHEGPNELQRQFAAWLGLNITAAKSRYDAGGPIYHVLLLRAWVYSVWRTITGTEAALHRQTGLTDEVAVPIAREMEVAGLFESVDKIATTDGRESDVWYRMSKKAMSSPAFRFAAERLNVATPVTEASNGAWEDAAEPYPARRRRSRERRPQSKGCLVLFGFVVGVVAVGLWFV